VSAATPREIFYTLKEAKIVVESWRRHHVKA
jgi:hypothetical protein